LAVIHSAPYDDEIHNIRYVSGHGVAWLIRAANSLDVHPPGSYLVNKLLLWMFRSWPLVKIAGGVLNGIGLSVFYGLAHGKIDKAQRPLLVFLLAAAATTVMWGASVRWYAYFNPLFAVTIAVLMFSSLSCTWRTVVLGASSVVLFHISYAAFCAVPALLAVHLVREWHTFKTGGRDLTFLFVIGGVALALCIPQLLVFVQVHSAHEGRQRGSIIEALASTALTLVIGDAAFPTAAVPILAAFVIVLSVGYWLVRGPLSFTDKLSLVALAVGAAAMIATGLGVKPRNSVYLIPLVSLLVSSALSRLPTAAAVVAIGVVALSELISVRNVILHEGTSKGSYNTDYLAMVDRIRGWDARCGGNMRVFNHDAVLTFLLEQAKIPQSSPYQRYSEDKVGLGPGTCVALVKTYRASFARHVVQEFYAEIENLHLIGLDQADIGPDPYYRQKSLIGHEPFPAHYGTLQLFRVREATSVENWRAPMGRGGPYPAVFSSP